MTDLLIQPGGYLQVINSEIAGDAPEGRVLGAGAEGQIIRLIVDEKDGTDFEVWMGIDPTQPINVHARHTIERLSGVHIMCFGPVLITHLEANAAKEMTRG